MPNRQPPGFLAIPTSGQGPGLVVLHAWWGLNETMKTLCGRLAAEGFVTFAPDLYHGRIGDTVPEAKRLSGELDEARANSDVSDAIAYVSGRPDVTGAGVGLVAFSLGVYFALGHSVEDPDRVRQVVIFYGTRDGAFGRSNASYLGHFAQTDPYEPESAVRELEESLRAAGRPVTFHTYPGTGHWFFEPDRADAYNEEAARSAWERTVAFLKGAPAR